MAASKILLADEDTQMLSVLALHLRNEEYEVICAEEGMDVLYVARRARPDLLVVNVFMTIDGQRTLFESLADFPELLETRVICLVPSKLRPGVKAPKLPEEVTLRMPVATGELLRKVDAALGGGELTDSQRQSRVRTA